MTDPAFDQYQIFTGASALRLQQPISIRPERMTRKKMEGYDGEGQINETVPDMGRGERKI